MDWCAEHDEIIGNLLKNEDLPTSKIAKRLNVSRNAVLGRIHRNPQLRELAAARYKRKKMPKEQRNKPLLTLGTGKAPGSMLPTPVGNTASQPLPASSDHRMGAGRPLINVLNCGGCRWPVNEAEPGELHLFCGEVVANVMVPYCTHHNTLNIKLVVRKSRASVPLIGWQ